jgi:hypothetical protein
MRGMINGRSILYESKSFEAAVSTIWEIAVIVKILKRMGYNPAQENTRESRGAGQLPQGTA